VTSRRRKRAQNKLDVMAVRQIRAEGAAGLGVNIEQLGKKYGVSVSTIKAVLNRRTWKNVE
jgi:DNA invertase Pin-like site-specific DNA recombinase